MTKNFNCDKKNTTPREFYDYVIECAGVAGLSEYLPECFEDWAKPKNVHPRLRCEIRHKTNTGIQRQTEITDVQPYDLYVYVENEYIIDFYFSRDNNSGYCDIIAYTDTFKKPENPIHYRTKTA